MFRLAQNHLSGVKGGIATPEHPVLAANAGFFRPQYSVLPLKDAQNASWRGYHLSEKMDGVYAVRRFNGCTVTGESMKDGRFFAWDIPIAFGEDIRGRQCREREQALTQLFSRLNPKLNWHRAATGSGFEFVEAVLANGGEGVVAKPFDSPFGYGWMKIKRSETHDCIVTEKHPSKLSVHLLENGIDRGWVAILGGDYFNGFELDKISIGDVIEIECYGITANDKFREPRYVRGRPDKNG
jgi:hypothetical protein